MAAWVKPYYPKNLVALYPATTLAKKIGFTPAKLAKVYINTL